MRLLMVIQGWEAVASRYRALQYVPLLRERGWEVEVLPYASTLRGRWEIVRAGRAADVCFVQKKRLPGWQLRAIRAAGTRIVYDVDDAVLFRSSRHAERSSGTRRRRFERALRHADLVVAGNDYLKGLVARVNPRVVVQPLAFDLEHYPPRRSYAAGSGITLGWIGGKKSLPFLRGLAPALERVAEAHPEVRLKIVCSDFFSLERLPVIEKPWREAEEGEDVASFDVGLAPLPDDEWARGKCGTKLLQYFCAAVPAVASPVGVHEALLDGGRNGLPARSLEEWEEALRRLVESPGLRERLGRAGRRYVEEHQTLERLAPRLDGLLREVAGAPRGRDRPAPRRDAQMPATSR